MCRGCYEGSFRAYLVAPPGAEEWLGQLLLSVANEYGGDADALVMVVGVLSAYTSGAQSREIARLMFGCKPDQVVTAMFAQDGELKAAANILDVSERPR